MSGEKQEFSVKDRRHFAADGSPREAEGGAANAETPEAAGGGAGSTEPEPPVSFAAFVLSLASQAQLLLKMEGQERPTPEELGHVRHIVAILEMLQQKTKVGLDADEQRLLEHLLFEVRMGYVQRAEGDSA